MDATLKYLITLVGVLLLSLSGDITFLVTIGCVFVIKNHSQQQQQHQQQNVEQEGNNIQVISSRQHHPNLKRIVERLDELEERNEEIQTSVDSSQSHSIVATSLKVKHTETARDSVLVLQSLSRKANTRLTQEYNTSCVEKVQSELKSKRFAVLATKLEHEQCSSSNKIVALIRTRLHSHQEKEDVKRLGSVVLKATEHEAFNEYVQSLNTIESATMHRTKVNFEGVTHLQNNILKNIDEAMLVQQRERVVRLQSAISCVLRGCVVDYTMSRIVLQSLWRSTLAKDGTVEQSLGALQEAIRQRLSNPQSDEVLPAVMHTAIVKEDLHSKVHCVYILQSKARSLSEDSSSSAVLSACCKASLCDKPQMQHCTLLQASFRNLLSGSPAQVIDANESVYCSIQSRIRAKQAKQIYQQKVANLSIAQCCLATEFLRLERIENVLIVQACIRGRSVTPHSFRKVEIIQSLSKTLHTKVEAGTGVVISRLSSAVKESHARCALQRCIEDATLIAAVCKCLEREMDYQTKDVQAVVRRSLANSVYDGCQSGIRIMQSVLQQSRCERPDVRTMQELISVNLKLGKINCLQATVESSQVSYDNRSDVLLLQAFAKTNSTDAQITDLKSVQAVCREYVVKHAEKASTTKQDDTLSALQTVMQTAQVRDQHSQRINFIVVAQAVVHRRSCTLESVVSSLQAAIQNSQQISYAIEVTKVTAIGSLFRANARELCEGDRISEISKIQAAARKSLSFNDDNCVCISLQAIFTTVGAESKVGAKSVRCLQSVACTSLASYQLQEGIDSVKELKRAASGLSTNDTFEDLTLMQVLQSCCRYSPAYTERRGAAESVAVLQAASKNTKLYPLFVEIIKVQSAASQHCTVAKLEHVAPLQAVCRTARISRNTSLISIQSKIRSALRVRKGTRVYSQALRLQDAIFSSWMTNRSQTQRNAEQTVIIQSKMRTALLRAVFEGYSTKAVVAQAMSLERAKMVGHTLSHIVCIQVSVRSKLVELPVVAQLQSRSLAESIKREHLCSIRTVIVLQAAVSASLRKRQSTSLKTSANIIGLVSLNQKLNKRIDVVCKLQTCVLQRIDESKHEDKEQAVSALSAACSIHLHSTHSDSSVVSLQAVISSKRESICDESILHIQNLSKDLIAKERLENILHSVMVLQHSIHSSYKIESYRSERKSLTCLQSHLHSCANISSIKLRRECCDIVHRRKIAAKAQLEYRKELDKYTAPVTSLQATISGRLIYEDSFLVEVTTPRQPTKKSDENFSTQRTLEKLSRIRANRDNGYDTDRVQDTARFNSDQATKLVQHCIQTKQEHLDLSKLSLSSLPPELSLCRHLKTLNLSNNSLSMLPPWFGDTFKNVVDINLANNRLFELPDNFVQLTKLRVLDLSNNKFEYFPLELTDMLIESLNISNNSMLMIQGDIGNMKNLSYLDISSNNLMALPEELVELKKLKALCIENNKFFQSEIANITRIFAPMLRTVREKRDFINSIRTTENLGYSSTAAKRTLSNIERGPRASLSTDDVTDFTDITELWAEQFDDYSDDSQSDSVSPRDEETEDDDCSTSSSVSSPRPDALGLSPRISPTQRPKLSQPVSIPSLTLPLIKVTEEHVVETPRSNSSTPRSGSPDLRLPPVVQLSPHQQADLLLSTHTTEPTVNADMIDFHKRNSVKIADMVDKETLKELQNLKKTKKIDYTERIGLLLECLESERKYVKFLQVLYDLYYTPIVENKNTGEKTSLFSKRLVSTKAASKMFPPNLKSIIACNRHFLGKLEKRFSVYQDKDPAGLYFLAISDIFIGLIPYLDVYISYLTKYEQANSEIRAYRAKHKNFDTWITKRKKKKESSGLDMASLLIMPVQRIPRYKILLENLLKQTPPDHGDYDNLLKAIDAISDCAKTHNEKIREQNNLIKVQQIAKMLKMDDLPQENRFLIREGACSMNDASQKAYLFTDLIVMREKRRIQLVPTVHVYSLVGASIIGGGKNSICLQINSLRTSQIKDKSIELHFDSNQTKAIWMQDIVNAIDSLEKGEDSRKLLKPLSARSISQSIRRRMGLTSARVASITNSLTVTNNPRRRSSSDASAL